MAENELRFIDGDNELDVQIAPTGRFVGSDSFGKPVEEDISEQSLSAIAEHLNSTGTEILCDIDHSSCKPGADKDSRAAGWFSKFYTSVKGLFGKLRLTNLGKKLVEDREYRFLSPVFSLDENSQPDALHSVAMTNTPAFKGHIQPILNAEPVDGSNAQKIDNLDKDILKMTKEEVKEMILQILADIHEAKKAEEAKEENTDKVEDKIEDKVEDVVQNEGCSKECSEDKDKEVKNEDASTEEKEEAKKDKDDEVIKIEALNSAPSFQEAVDSSNRWKNLHGKEFFDYLTKNNNLI